MHTVYIYCIHILYTVCMYAVYMHISDVRMAVISAGTVDNPRVGIVSVFLLFD